MRIFIIILLLISINTHSITLAQNKQDTTMHYTHQQKRSFQAKLFAWIVQVAGIKNQIEKDLKKAKFNHRKAAPPKSFAKKFKLEIQKIEGKEVWVIAPKTGGTEQTIFYLHGGAYVYGVQSVYWKFVEELLLKTKATLIIPDYPLSPEHTVAEVYPFIAKTYEWVLSQTDPTNLIFLGDSAGAGLAFGFAQKLRDENQTLPQQLILLSPWLDIALNNPNIKAIEDKDPILAVKGLRMAGEAYAGDWAMTDFRISPIYGSLQDLPPISIFIGTHDIFYADTEKLKQDLDHQGISFNYYVYPELFHDWFIIVPKMKESKKVFEQLRGLIGE